MILIKKFLCNHFFSTFSQISNEYGTTTDEGKATVTRKTCAPTFKTGLKDTIAREGETSVEFSVEVNAYPKPKIKW